MGLHCVVVTSEPPGNIDRVVHQFQMVWVAAVPYSAQMVEDLA
jgi:hypothetical protein